MALDGFVAIGCLYAVVTCGVAILLLWGLRNSSNEAGRLFILSELMRVPMLITIVTVHLVPDYNSAPAYFVSNFTFLLSEICFVFSLHALSNRHEPKLFMFAAVAIVIICSIVEYIRSVEAAVPLVIYPVIFAMISASAIRICTRRSKDGAMSTPFWNILKYIECFLLCISLTRIAIFMADLGLSPLQKGWQNFAMVFVIIILMMFRFIAYHSIWMTSLSPNVQENLFNRNLMNSLRERDRLLQELSTANRRLGISALAGSLAHQLSQPLTGAVLLTESAKRDLKERGENEAGVVALEKVSSQLKNLARLVHDLRALFSSSPQAMTPFPLAAACREVFELIRGAHESARLGFLQSCSADPIVTGNRTQIQQVIINMMDNAIQAAETSHRASNRISMTIRTEGVSAIVNIEDDATGIAQDMLPHVFDLYRSTKSDGLGIGLWLCQEIAQRHGGRVSAANLPDGGARFTLELPLASAAS